MDEKQECVYRIGMWKVIKRTMVNGVTCYSVVRYGSPFIERTFDSISKAIAWCEYRKDE